jgi:type VI secretion system protein ImpF
MPDLASRERLQPSLLDRLTDDAPESTREGFDQQTLSMTQLRRAVLRDLAWLFNNTNLTATEDLSTTPLAAASVVNFGIPGFAGLSGSTAQLAHLEAGLAEAIRTFEPRIRPETVRVKLRRPGDSSDATIALEIRGELWAQPVPLPLFLETSIDLETRLAVVIDGRASG